MVNLVIVSHSARLAAGVQEMAEQMVQSKIGIAAAGGVDDEENPLGTDPMKVFAAVESVYSEDGVVVLIDLGSAMLSTETALEFLTPEQQANVHICPAPLVEGAIAGAVQAAVGGTVAQVMAEAQGALAAKMRQIGPAPETAETAKTAVTITPIEGETIEIIVPNRLGLHARPAARFVSAANRFEAEIQVRLGEKLANAKSINQVATLGVRQGDKIIVTARGEDAAGALAAVQALADDNFGDVDDEAAMETAVPAPTGDWTGIPASPGVAIGPVFQYRPRLPEVEVREITNPDKAWRRLQTAVSQSRAEIKTIHAQAVAQIGAEDAAIFEAHDLFLADPDLLGRAKAAIFERKINAEAAWQQAIQSMAAQYRQMDDAYMQARAADVEDVGQRVLSHLLSVERPSLNLKRPSILVASDLTPSDTANLDPAVVLGICTELGGATAHSAILARALGIPAIVGMGVQLEQLANGVNIGLDGQEGRIWISPSGDDLEMLAQKRIDWLTTQKQVKALAQKTAVTKDKKRINVEANIGGARDAATALAFGAEGVGLFRTEFLFLGRDSAPTEEEQVEAYREAAAAMGGKPVIIRTLDVGGDKPLPYLHQGEEDNPFLGWRGIRFCLDHPQIFMPQLRAILRAGHKQKIKMMFPMIGVLSELTAAKAMVETAKAELKAEKLKYDANMDVGVMIEVPSAAAIADLLAKEADFFSIGTNDLTQYVMAADRGNAQVAGLVNALQPAVLRMIQQTVEAAHKANIRVGICGELAGNAEATAVLVGLGLDELSMSAPAIPAVKEKIRQLSVHSAKKLAAAALQLDSAEAVLELLRG
jgi:phosphocarrier protein FPr